MNGGVRRILLFASLCLTVLPAAPAGAGGGCHSGDLPDVRRAVSGTEVEMAMMCFQPRVLAVPPGTSVRFTNDDQAVHVVIGTGWGTGDELALGEWVDHRFTQPGIYPYSCYLHPGMNGAIVVGDAAPAPSAVLAASSASGRGLAIPALAIGGIAGTVLGSVATRRRTRLGSRHG